MITSLDILKYHEKTRKEIRDQTEDFLSKVEILRKEESILCEVIERIYKKIRTNEEIGSIKILFDTEEPCEYGLTISLKKGDILKYQGNSFVVSCPDTFFNNISQIKGASIHGTFSVGTHIFQHWIEKGIAEEIK